MHNELTIHLKRMGVAAKEIRAWLVWRGKSVGYHCGSIYYLPDEDRLLRRGIPVECKVMPYTGVLVIKIQYHAGASRYRYSFQVEGNIPGYKVYSNTLTCRCLIGRGTCG